MIKHPTRSTNDYLRTSYFLICGSILTPPYTLVIFTPSVPPKSTNTSDTCTHNSLVGVRITHCKPPPRIILSNIGRQNASVFPEPVSACPTTSFPLIISGQHFSCIMVSSSNFSPVFYQQVFYLILVRQISSLLSPNALIFLK